MTGLKIFKESNQPHFESQSEFGQSWMSSENDNYKYIQITHALDRDKLQQCGTNKKAQLDLILISNQN